MLDSVKIVWLDVVAALFVASISFAFVHLAIKRHWLKQFGAGIGLLAFAIVLLFGAYIVYTGWVSDNTVQKSSQASKPVGSDGAAAMPPATPPPSPQETRGGASGVPATSRIDDATLSARGRGTYLNLSAVQSRRPLVVVVDRSTMHQALVSSVVADELDGNAGAFLQAFLHDGAFARAFGGDAGAFREVDGIGSAGPIVLGSVEFESADSDLADGLRQVHLTLDVRLFRPSRGFETQAFHFETDGAGFSDIAALRIAAERAAKALAERLR
jgi:hypothetical protein